MLAAHLILLSGIAGGEDPEAAPTPNRLDRIEVVGRRVESIGEARSASEGTISRDEIAARPMLRGGDMVEFVPGLVATQHSGSGKANQYFLRGFNLDHGTDFASFVDGMPVNMRSHGHGQGYTDLNFLIPELVQSLRYRKGPYHADVGDFSSAGSAQFRIADRVDGNRAELAAGEYGFARGLLLADTRAGSGNLLLALERQHHDGAWRDVDEDVGKRNVVLRWSGSGEVGDVHVMAMHYRNEWNSPDQIPLRAVESGLIDRLGSIDTTLGGTSARDSLSGGWQRDVGDGSWHARAYLIDYRLDLWSNFTYFLDEPERGDQFRQFDDRRYRGGDVSYLRQGDTLEWKLGLDYRRDDIDEVGLARSRARAPLEDIRRDSVSQYSVGLFADAELRLTPTLRAQFGLRSDHHRFAVKSDEPLNSGRRRASALSPKAGIAWSPDSALELYANIGEGLHSNDARGATLRVDPQSGEPADAVDPLVASRGGELGLRWILDDGLHASAALWRLGLDSELLFVGDAGNTEATRPSLREGVEVGLYWVGGRHWSADVELAWTDARFRDDDPAGEEIPGSVPFVASLSLRYVGDTDWFAQARWRHFGRYALIEDASERAANSSIVNLRAGRRFGSWTLALDVLNLFDSADFDIEYFYASRLPGEPDGGVEDRHVHAFEPRTLRLSASLAF